MTTSGRIYRLASKVAEFSADDKNVKLKQDWINLWNLEAKRPMVLSRPLILDMLAGFTPENTDPFLIGLERRLVHKLYKYEVLRDDEVLVPELTVSAVFSDGTHAGNMYGLPYDLNHGSKSFSFKPVVKDTEDLKKLHFPSPEVDEKATALLCERAEEAVGGLLKIRADRIRHWMLSWINPAYLANYYIGYENLLRGMVEVPDFIHAVMKFFSDSIMYNLREAEKRGYLPSPSRSKFNDIPDFISDGCGKPAGLLSQLTARGDSQEFSLVSPGMTEEFLLSYQRPILANFRYTHYGCCENFHKKWDLLRSIKNLRMFSVSPWTSMEEAVSEMGKEYIIDWRVKVQDVIGRQDTEAMKAEVRDGLRIADGHQIVVVLQDVETVNGNINLVRDWVQAAREGTES